MRTTFLVSPPKSLNRFDLHACNGALHPYNSPVYAYKVFLYACRADRNAFSFELNAYNFFGRRGPPRQIPSGFPHRRTESLRTRTTVRCTPANRPVRMQGRDLGVQDRAERVRRRVERVAGRAERLELFWQALRRLVQAWRVVVAPFGPGDGFTDMDL